MIVGKLVIRCERKQPGFRISGLIVRSSADGTKNLKQTYDTRLCYDQKRCFLPLTIPNTKGDQQYSITFDHTNNATYVARNSSVNSKLDCWDLGCVGLRRQHNW